MKTKGFNQTSGIKFMILAFLISQLCLSAVYAQECSKTAGEKPKGCTQKTLADAAWSNNLDAIKKLVEQEGVSPDARLKDGVTPLMAAAYMGYQELALYLLEKGADTELRNNWDITPLRSAADRGHIAVVKLLLKHGAVINTKCKSGMTPLHGACFNIQPEIVELLIHAGADVNALDNQKRTPLIMASWKDNLKQVQMLVEHGADMNAVDPNGGTALHNLVRNGKTEIVSYLLSKGANADVANNQGLLPLQVAAKFAWEDAAELLISNTQDMNTQEKVSGNTALHLAAINGNTAISNALLKSGANADIKNDKGQTPLAFAIAYGHGDLLAYYREEGLAKKSHLADLAKNKKEILSDKLHGQAQVTYTGHAGWVVQTANHVLVFDYLNRPGIANPCLLNGAICTDEMKDKKVVVFYTHDHGDHYDTTTFAWDAAIDDISYVFGFKPEASSRYESKKYIGPEVIYFDNNTSEKVGTVKLTTIKSNDSGQGFLVDVDGVRILHPGDHAYFAPEDEEGFKKEVDFLAEEVGSVDIAFLSVTGCPVRWKKENIVEGFFYYIDKLNPTQVYPMHAGSREHLLLAFAELAEERACKADIVCVENSGDHHIFSTSLQAGK